MNGYSNGEIPLYACQCGTTLCRLPGEYLDCCKAADVPLLCVLCDEAINFLSDAWTPLNAAQYAHHECGLREVMGGIGHLIAHEYWCPRDTDAGLTRRQSAQMVAALVDILGVEAVVERGAIT